MARVKAHFKRSHFRVSAACGHLCGIDTPLTAAPACFRVWL